MSTDRNSTTTPNIDRVPGPKPLGRKVSAFLAVLAAVAPNLFFGIVIFGGADLLGGRLFQLDSTDVKVICAIAGFSLLMGSIGAIKTWGDHLMTLLLSTVMAAVSAVAVLCWLFISQ